MANNLPSKEPILIERVPTGIKNFDDLIQGGFEKNSTNLLVGGSGCGKSIFSINFLIEGARRGENCLYITFEEKKKGFYANMSEFGFDLEYYESKGLFYFLEYTPEKVRTMLEEGGGAIENIIISKKINRIVIDSITSFDLLFEREIDKREAALELFGFIRKWNCTSLLTFEGNADAEQKATSRVIDFESDSIILMYLVRKKNKRMRFMEILKMRGTKHSLEVHEYNIGESGIIINKEPFEDDIDLGR